MATLLQKLEARRGSLRALERLHSANIFELEKTEDEPFETLLHIAAKFGYPGFVDKLISDLGDPGLTKSNQYGFTALHIACAKGKLAVVEILWKYEHLRSLQGTGGMTPLLCACEAGNGEIIDFILGQDPDLIKERTDFGESALHLVIKNRHANLLPKLVGILEQNDYLEEMDWKDVEGNTLIHSTVLAGNYQALKYLLEWKKEAVCGLEINARNNVGETALDLCPPSLGKAPYYYIEKALKREIEHMSDASSSARRTSNEGQSSPNNKLKYTLSTVGNVETFLKKNRRAVGPNEIRVDLLLLFTMGASLAFQAGMSPPVAPVSIHNDRAGTCPSPSHSMCPSPSPSPNDVPDGCGDYGYMIFIFFNGVAFYTSIFSLMTLVPYFRLLWNVNLLLLALLVTYNHTLITNTHEGPCQMIVGGYCLLMPGVLYLLSRLSIFLITRRIKNSEKEAGQEPTGYERVSQEDV